MKTKKYKVELTVQVKVTKYSCGNNKYEAGFNALSEIACEASKGNCVSGEYIGGEVKRVAVCKPDDPRFDIFGFPDDEP